jgi:hypothetical protein
MVQPGEDEMEPCDTSNEVVVLARSAEVRVLGSAREAEHALLDGFRQVAVLAVSGDADRIRMTLLGDGEPALPSEPGALAALLELLERLGSGPCEAC